MIRRPPRSTRTYPLVPNTTLCRSLQWAIAIGAGAVAIHVDRIPVYLLAGFVIGSRIQCLAVMMHDACHGMLFSNRRLNDLIGDIFVAYPLGFSIDLYRANHMYHHRYTNTLRDREIGRAHV